MEKEYIAAFSSFYKAAYAQDILEEAGIKVRLAKLPQELMRSCSTGIYIKAGDIHQARSVLPVLQARQIDIRGIYAVDDLGKGRKSYKKIM